MLASILMRVLQQLSQLRSNLRTRSTTSLLALRARQTASGCPTTAPACVLPLGRAPPELRSQAVAIGRSLGKFCLGVDERSKRARRCSPPPPVTARCCSRLFQGSDSLLGRPDRLLVVLVGVESVGKGAETCTCVRPSRAQPAQASAATPCCYATEQRCKSQRVTRGPGLEP